MITTVNWTWLFETTTDSADALAVALGAGLVEIPNIDATGARTRVLQAA